MNFRGLLQRAAARRNPEILRAGAPPEGESMEEDPVEVQAVRDCIAKVFEAREARALVVGQRDVLVQELNQSVEERTAVQSQITAREKEIALAGGELPDDPFPEEADTFGSGKSASAFARVSYRRGKRASIHGFARWRKRGSHWARQ
jgi:hypothetical protein